MNQNLRTRAIVFSRPLHAELHEGVRLPDMDDEGILIRTEYSTIYSHPERYLTCAFKW